MGVKFKIIITALMVIGFAAGFCDALFTRITAYDIERIHIFFFNLCCGGTIILYYTEAKNRIHYKTGAFFLLSVVFSVTAFLNLYIISIIILLILAFITETVRIKKFSFFPFQFFKSDASVAKKFHQASLLCLSIGLILSVLAIINQQYYQIAHSDKAGLNAFFLGFSFPLSLITFSLIFSFVRKTETALIFFLKNISFWTINAGVIIFFAFILLNIKTAQFFIAVILLAAVINILILFYKFSEASGQKSLLISGLFFLIVTATTGILYIKTDLLPQNYYDNIRMVIKMHAVVALYGWNLTGLAVILRYNDFPIKQNFKIIIPLHWLIILIFTFFGYSSLFFAILATLFFLALLTLLFFSPAQKSIKDEQRRKANRA